MRNKPDIEGNVIFERYARIVFSSLMVAVMMWVGSTLNGQIKSIARLEERNVSLAHQVAQLSEEIHEQANTFYTHSEAKRDKQEFNNQLKRIKTHINRLENRTEKN